MKILYLHGLLGRLNEEKRAVLENYGEVFAPEIDYQNNPGSILELIARYRQPDQMVEVVIGSSMGGFAGWHISAALQCPALLFNPAISRQSVEQMLPDQTGSHQGFLQIVLGAKDEVVDPSQTLLRLAQDLPQRADLHIHLRPQLAHRIPPAVFAEEVECFFKELSR